MSEPLTISELLACVLGGDYLNYGSDAEVLADIARMLPDRDAKLIARAKREQMEADLSAIGNVRGRHWRDLSDGFQFAEEAIRATWAKAHPEGEKKEANVAIVPYATVDGQPCDGNGKLLPEVPK